MAGVFIDPAESFSRALDQGLSTMKSFRDEERRDEDRAFEKMMRERSYKLQEEQLGLMKNQDAREDFEFKFNNSPEMLNLKTRRATAETTEAESKATEAGIFAKNRQRMIDTDISTQTTNARANMIQAGASSMNARTNAGRLALDTRMYNDDRTDKAQRKAIANNFGLVVSYAQDPTPEKAKKLVGNKVAAANIMKIAAAATDSQSLVEAVQNPYGDWINDKGKLQSVLRFARVTPVVDATMKQQGFLRGTKIERIRGAKVKDTNGIPRQMVEITLRGPTAGGKTKTFTGYVSPDRLFEPAAVAANTFSVLGRSKAAQSRLAQAFAYADEEAYNKILQQEVDRIDKMLDSYGNLSTYRQQAQALRARKAAIFDGDPNVHADVVFTGLGRIGSASY